MTKVSKSALPSPRQRAGLSLRVGRAARLRVDVALTGKGLLAVAVLVSSTLLSTALLVRTVLVHRR